MEVVGLCALTTLVLGGCSCRKQVSAPHDDGRARAAASRARTQPDARAAEWPVNGAFERALEATGPDYLRDALDLRQAAPLAPALNARLLQASADGEPIARLLARVVLDWSSPKRADFEAALDYLDGLPGKLARTAMGKPSPTGTESYLTLHFGDRVADLLALRLIKQDAWPEWKVRAVVFYLTTHRRPSATVALIRFAIETPDGESRELAVAGIHAVGDPALRVLLADELARARRLRRPVPNEVRALAE